MKTQTKNESKADKPGFLVNKPGFWVNKSKTGDYALCEINGDRYICGVEHLAKFIEGTHKGVHFDRLPAKSEENGAF